MRYLFLVMVAAAAAFAGGAVINGPGARWVQARLLDYMGLKDGGEIASIDPPRGPDSPERTQPPAPETTSKNPSSGASQPKNVNGPASPPAADAKPGLAGMLGSLAALANKATSGGEAGSGSSAPKVESSAAATPPLPIPKAVPEPQPASVPKAAEPGPAPLDPEVSTVLLASRSPAGTGAASVTKVSSASDQIPLEVAPASDPSSNSAQEKTSREPSTPPQTPTAASQEDWSRIRQKLRSLGVSRYTIEGQPGGRVNFSCLIPLAGRQAVCQRFEAEGDDELQAARLALRRITLWRAARPAADRSP